MATVNVLVAVDVEGALASGDLGGNAYMVDTNKYAGSGPEGTSNLQTHLAIGDIIVWSVVSVDPGNNVEFKGFLGKPVNEKLIDPVPMPLSPASFESKFQPPGGTASGTKFQYTISLSFEGKVMNFAPFLFTK